MAQPSEELQQELLSVLTGNYLTYSVLCLVVYEYSITLHQEVAVVWRRKPTVTSVLLLTTRWLMLLNPILNATPSTGAWCESESAEWNYDEFIDLMSPHIIPRCKQAFVLDKLIYFMETVLVSLFSALRVWALWRESWTKYALLTIILILGTVPVGTNIFLWARSVIEYTVTPSLITCTYIDKIPPNLNTNVLLVINILDLLTFSESGNDGTYINIFVSFMPLLLVQRFMLNLRRLGTADGSSSDTHHPSLPSISFRAPSDFLGNIGEPLDHSHLERVEGIGDDDSWEAEELRGGLEEGFAHQPDPPVLYQDGTIETAGVAATALKSAEHSSERDVIVFESSAYSRETVEVGPSAIAH
ncbi:uncharacterized protein PHACADRAFT_207600 [Phanerochaete carnosa HHB-10118-sp]|uniref:DUF6533 domain-containing protein n=1 Tax=Phanerochaete carnosa (strain HHB-10118-sp) TaxID=650164 RepID=K5VXP5_PHACS|nr:uncharacterized protein PHACADRAFT_207600 [Phanerochaete carnosa HHB-10118-sp]EKM56328.1 hypothetical protein PHACADRAFT_207600 [Phanerochaete carnosa HHB-10118-sp]